MIPFSNGTESMDWLAMNCERCKMYGCSARKNIELGFVSGEVSQRTADYVGGFNKPCQNFLENPIKRIKKINEDINQTKIEL